jgi:hypothetical protein
MFDGLHNLVGFGGPIDEKKSMIAALSSRMPTRSSFAYPLPLGV